MGILNKSRCYLAGNIENADSASGWRDLVKEKLKHTGICFFDPLHKPFADSINEDKAHTERLLKLRSEGQYEEVSSILRKIRVEDLSVVDRVDFLIVNISSKVASFGTAEELFWANRLKKQMFIINREGKKNCSLWLFGTVNHEQIFDSVDEVIERIDKINSGQIKIDELKWKLFKIE